MDANTSNTQSEDEAAKSHFRERESEAKWDAVNDEIRRENKRLDNNPFTPLFLPENSEPNGLCQLPLEMRYEIYEHLLPWKRRTIDLSKENHATYMAFDHLRLSCKQLNEEIVAWLERTPYRGFVRTPDFGWIDPDNTMFKFTITRAFRGRHLGHVQYWWNNPSRNVQFQHLGFQNDRCKWCMINRASTKNTIRHLKISLYRQDNYNYVDSADDQTPNKSGHDNLLLVKFVQQLVPRLKTLKVSIHWGWIWQTLGPGYFDMVGWSRIPVCNQYFSRLDIVSEGQTFELWNYLPTLPEPELVRRIP